MADEPLNSLFKMLRDRDISYNREDLKAAYGSPEHEAGIQAWIGEYVSSGTLLTKEEAAL